MRLALFQELNLKGHSGGWSTENCLENSSKKNVMQIVLEIVPNPFCANHTVGEEIMPKILAFYKIL